MANPQPVEKLLSESKEKAADAETKQAAASSFVGEVWQVLSRVDCTDFIEKKGTGNYQLTYLSWAHAWGALMERFPESDYCFDEPHTFPDGTQEIWVTVWVKRGENLSERRMWLPVMNHQNKPIINPNAFQVNTTRMRCLTKCLALFGLGHYIYAGEDIPRKENDAAAVGDLPKNSTGRAPQSTAKTVMDEMGLKVTPEAESYAQGIAEAIQNEDAPGLKELADELNEDAEMKTVVWNILSREEKKQMKTMLGVDKA